MLNSEFLFNSVSASSFVLGSTTFKDSQITGSISIQGSLTTTGNITIDGDVDIIVNGKKREEVAGDFDMFMDNKDYGFK